MSKAGARVVVVGSINMDIVARVQRHPVPGETVPGSDLSYFPGGKGANQAVAAARAGAQVAMLGAVGGDAFGPDLLDFLRVNEIATDGVERRSVDATGTALIVVDAAGENSIVVVPGANGAVGPDVVQRLTPRKGDVLVAQFETPVEATAALFMSGRETGATCVLNPAPAAAVARGLLGLVDVLVVNETELGVIAGRNLGESPTVEEVRDAYALLRKLGFDGCLVATLGAKGSLTLIGDRVIEIKGRVVEAVDTTGAGDCFVGYLASSLALGRDMDNALLIANAAASLCVQRPGAGPSMPRRAEVEVLMELQT